MEDHREPSEVGGVTRGIIGGCIVHGIEPRDVVTAGREARRRVVHHRDLQCVKATIQVRVDLAHNTPASSYRDKFNPWPQDLLLKQNGHVP